MLIGVASALEVFDHRPVQPLKLFCLHARSSPGGSVNQGITFHGRAVQKSNSHHSRIVLNHAADHARPVRLRVFELLLPEYLPDARDVAFLKCPYQHYCGSLTPLRVIEVPNPDPPCVPLLSAVPLPALLLGNDTFTVPPAFTAAGVAPP